MHDVTRLQHRVVVEVRDLKTFDDHQLNRRNRNNECMRHMQSKH